MGKEVKTLAEARKLRYGKWAGCPEGHAYDPSRCAAEVWANDRFPTPHQCFKKPGRGPGGLYCATHDPEARARREEAKRKRWDDEQERESQNHRDMAVGAALRLADPGLYCKLAEDAGA